MSASGGMGATDATGASAASGVGAAAAAPATGVDALVSSLLYEGYALYPYTPGAHKNATPTPFGIVYPRDYAARHPHTFAHLRCEAVLEPAGAASKAAVSVEVRFLEARGERHQAVERRVTVPATGLGILASAARAVAVPAEADLSPLAGDLRVSAEPLENGRWRVRVTLENRTPVADAAALDRPAALARAFLSTHVVLRAARARFVSPLERVGARGADVAACRNENTWPVLASPDDDVLLGAAIVLPDHPALAPESQVNLFDHTEIEEALLLHVRVLSDGERESIAAQDPAVREMLARALAATPESVFALHAMMRPVEAASPAHGEGPAPDAPPALAPAAIAAPSPAAVDGGAEEGENFRYLSRPRDDGPFGEREFTFEGRVFRPGLRVRLRLAPDAGVHEKMVDGRAGTIERILVDDQGRAHLGMTFDDDPGRELFRDSGRLLYFFPHEVDLLP